MSALLAGGVALGEGSGTEVLYLLLSRPIGVNGVDAG